jgi:small acid-soluble spore protein F (minor alpha/beta-type SASP)
MNLEAAFAGRFFAFSFLSHNAVLEMRILKRCRSFYFINCQEGLSMSRRKRSVMSENLKIELAKELGFYDTVRQEGWGGIKAKDAGNMVKRAIQLAEKAASEQK